MLRPQRVISACLIGDPPSERFHSMGVYAKGLESGFSEIDGLRITIHRWPDLPIPSGRYASAMSMYWRRFVAYPRMLAVPAADIYHILDHSYAHLIGRLPAKRTVITCHDLMPLIIKDYRKSLGGWLSQAAFRYSVSRLKRVRMVLVDSAATKNAAMDILGLTAESMAVVPLGVDGLFTASMAPAARRSTVIGRYILQVGATSEPYKNTMNILRAFTLVHKRTAGLVKLVKVGKPYTDEQAKYINNMGLASHIIQLGHVARCELPDIYRCAVMLVMPSLHEGFGLPLLEAMASGLPVVTSRCGSIPEVVGDAALYVDPNDPVSIASGIDQVLENGQLRKELIRKGQARVRLFSWQHTAAATADVYRSVVGGS